MNNIKRNDDLEIDIENKYLKYKENVKFTTEEAIYILKRKDFIDEVEYIALENLIQENKELKEKAKNTMGLIGANYIHKDKVKEKINQYKEIRDEILKIESKTLKPSITLDLKRNDYCMKILQELLKEGGKQ